jgi:hypothetical protein
VEKADTPLFIGTVDFIIQGSILTDLGIRAVVTLLSSVPPEAFPILRAHGVELPADHMSFPLEDSSDSYISLFHGCGVLNVVDFIHQKRIEGKPVLVHCDAGFTRSPAIIVAYLMKYGPDLYACNPLAYHDAVHLLLQMRGPRVDVRVFERELIMLERQLHHPSGGGGGPQTPLHHFSPRSESICSLTASPLILRLPSSHHRSPSVISANGGVDDSTSSPTLSVSSYTSTSRGGAGPGTPIAMPTWGPPSPQACRVTLAYPATRSLRFPPQPLMPISPVLIPLGVSVQKSKPPAFSLT